MTNIRDKLNETIFFLEEMKSRTFDPIKFRYDLSAFSSAIRSVGYIMEEEFPKRPGFSEWYTQKWNEMKNDPILKYMHTQRDIATHRHPIVYPINTTEQDITSTRMNIIITGTRSNTLISKTVTFPVVPSTITTVKYYFNDIVSKEKDVIVICQEAVDIIESIVNECENKFGGASS